MSPILTTTADVDITDNDSENSFGFVLASQAYSEAAPSHSRLQRAGKAASKWLASQDATSIRHRTADVVRKVFSKDSSTALYDNESTTTQDDSGSQEDSTAWSDLASWNDSATWNKSATWDNSTSWDNSATWNDSTKSSSSAQSSTGWDDSSATTTTTVGTSALATIVSSSSPKSFVIKNITIESAFLASFLATKRHLDIPPAVKHQLATYLKRVLEAACFSFLTVHAPHMLELLRLDSYDTIDINVWITLLGYLRSHECIPASAFATPITGSLEWPNINSRCEEEINARTDNIGRLRQVAVHRWDYDANLLKDAIGFLAILNDKKWITDVESVLQRLHTTTIDIPTAPCTTKSGLLTTLVSILERAFFGFARIHRPEFLDMHEIAHTHAMELQDFGEGICGFVSLYRQLETTQTRESSDICRTLRNAAAHHTAFTAEAIEGRRGCSFKTRYDHCDDPYKAIAADAEKVAVMLGDKKAARQIGFATWVAGIAVSGRKRREELEEEKGKEKRDGKFYLARAKKAKTIRGWVKGDSGWEAEATLFNRLRDMERFFEGRAKELEPWNVFERWGGTPLSADSIVDPRIERDISWI